MTLTDHQDGLRFDIYERVHLSEGVAGIKELEEVELVPHIQVLPQGDQAILRGNLLLSGTYVDEQNAVNRTLEHLIPVEITLPMNRVQRVEDIAVEIENFDIDLLSARSLNITGVLSLNGLEVVSGASAEPWSETEEEVVFIHEAQQSYQAGSEGPRADQSAHNVKFELAQVKTNFTAAPVSEFNAFDFHEKRQGITDFTADHSYSSILDNSQSQEEGQGQGNAPVEFAATPMIEGLSDEVLTVSATPEEKKDLKIAFAGKKPDDDPPAVSNGLASLLHSHYTNKLETRNHESLTAPAPETIGTNDKLEWKKLLLSSTHEQQQFRRLRICIVQREETLDTIAKRYNLNPREISLFNRLGENNVTEGQIVYIPK